MKPIVVINPNSTLSVTNGLDRAVQPLRLAGGPDIECVTLDGGPPGIETQEQVDAVVAPICDLVRARRDEASAFVIACYSDPGLAEARESASSPVFGIAESAMLTALTRGSRFGVISILHDSVVRHLRHVDSMGLRSRLAGDRAVGLRVTELADEARTLRRMVDVGEKLRDHDGADVLIMGCAGMARYRDRLEATLGLPVIEPTQAAVTLALGAVLLGPARR